MSATAVRITRSAHQKLSQMAEEDGVSLTEELERIIEAQRRQRMLEEVNRAYARLKQDPQAWAEELAERELWETTLMDGLQDDPPYEPGSQEET